MSFEVGTGFEPVLTDLQSVASPLGQPTVEAKGLLRADDEARTRDLNLGKVALYQLSYVRLQLPGLPVGAIRTISDASPSTNSVARCVLPRPPATRLVPCRYGRTDGSWTTPTNRC